MVVVVVLLDGALPLLLPAILSLLQDAGEKIQHRCHRRAVLVVPAGHNNDWISALALARQIENGPPEEGKDAIFSST